MSEETNDVPTVGNDLLKFVNSLKFSQEEFIFPEINNLDEITLDDFTGEQYFVDSSRLAIFMLIFFFIWIILLIFSKKHYLDWLCCAKSSKCGIMFSISLLFLSLVNIGLAIPGLNLLNTGLQEFSISSRTFSEIFKASNEELEVFSFVFNENENCNEFNLSVSELQNTIDNTLELTTEASNSIDTGTQSIINSLQWVEVFFVVFSILLAIVNLMLAFSFIKFYFSSTKEDEIVGYACFGISYTFGVFIVAVVWIISAMLSIPTFVGSDLCLGDPSENLQKSFKLNSDVTQDDLCFPNEDVTQEAKFGNFVCYYSECRGELYLFDEINNTLQIDIVLDDISNISNINTTGSDIECFEDINETISELDDLIIVINETILDCERTDLDSLFLLILNDELCSMVVVGYATISFNWGLSALLTMIVMIVGLMNSQLTLKESIKRGQKLRKKKKKKDRKILALVNKNVADVEVVEKSRKSSSKFEDGEDEEYLQEDIDEPNIDAEPLRESKRKRSSAEISF